MVLMIACAHVQLAQAQSLSQPVVIVSPPSKDEEVWMKISDRKSPILSIEVLKTKFDSEEYTVIEDDAGMIFIFHKEYSPMRRNAIEEIVLSAALRLGDANGAFSYGDLSTAEQKAAGELFGESFRSGISTMGDQARNVKISLGAELSLTAVSSSKQVRSSVNPRQDNDTFKAHWRDMQAHGVVIREQTQEDLERQVNKSAEEARGSYGLSVRFIGVHKKRQGGMVRLAMDALDRFLTEERKNGAETHENLTDKLLLSHLEEFNGNFPESVAKSQVPSRIWQLFEQQVRYSPSFRGFGSETEVEQFLSSVTTVRLDTSFLLTYFKSVSDQSSNSGPGSAVQIEIRR